MSTPTPITDAAEQTITIDCDDSCVSIYVYESDKIYEGGLVPSHASRRLELDRSALMEALESSERISRAIKRGEPMIEARFNAMVDEFEAKRESALSTARANFPES